MQHLSLPRRRPEEQGVSPSHILSFINALEENHIECHGFTIVRHGSVVAEAFWKPYRKELPHMLFSLSKSFTAMAVGLCVNEGLFCVNDPVTGFFKEDLPKKMDDKFRNLRMQHLLCMATGHKEDFLDKVVTRRDHNWVRHFFENPLEYEPGTHFVYNNMATYMLSAIVTKVTGQSVLDYLIPRLFNKLGIEKPFWGTDFNGNNLGAWGLSVKNDDLAKFGLMILNKGMFYGERVIPEDWIIEATNPKIANGNNPDNDWNQGYGYQFWMCRHNAFRGDGAFGQYCIVLPEQDAVVAINSGIPEMQAVLDLVYDHLLPGMSDNPLPASGDYEKLISKCGSLHYDPKVVKTECRIMSPYMGRTYILEKNRFGLKDLSISLEKDILTISLKGPGGMNLTAGIGEWIDGTAKLNDDPIPKRQYYRTAGTYSWEDESSLLLDVRYIETPFRYIIRCRFEGNKANLTITPNVSMAPNSEIKLEGFSR